MHSQPPPSKPKRPYRQPTLHVYGDLRKITATDFTASPNADDVSATDKTS